MMAWVSVLVMLVCAACRESDGSGSGVAAPEIHGGPFLMALAVVVVALLIVRDESNRGRRL